MKGGGALNDDTTKPKEKSQQPQLSFMGEEDEETEAPI